MKASSSRARRIKGLVAPLVTALLVACGTTSTEPPSHAPDAGGTSAAGGCSQGDTRTCVGPGACPGGQACGADGKWAACECGSTATSGGAGGAGDVTDASQTDRGGKGGRASNPADASKDHTTDGSPNPDGGQDAGDDLGPWTDDPCPTDPDEVVEACDGTCGTMEPFDCSGVECGGGSASFPWSSIATRRRVFRTPAHGGKVCSCEQSHSDVIHSIAIALPAGDARSVSVGPPWKVRQGGAVPLCAPATDSCINLPQNMEFVFLQTTVADPPIRNVVVVLGGTCP